MNNIKKLNVYVEGCDGRCVALEMAPPYTVRCLKERIADHFPSSCGKNARLTCKGRPLRNEGCLMEYGIQQGDRIVMKERLCGGAPVSGFKFPSLDCGKFRGFGATAPEYRRIASGLNLEGKCSNPNCIACDKLCWANIGFSPKEGFQIGKLLFSVRCPICSEKINPTSIVSCGFYKCSYVFNGGDLKTGKEHFGYDQCWSSTKFLIHDGNVSFRKWAFLTITVSSNAFKKYEY